MYIHPGQISIIYSIVSNGSFENITAYYVKGSTKCIFSLWIIEMLEPNSAIRASSHSKALRVRQPGEPGSQGVHLTCSNTL